MNGYLFKILRERKWSLLLFFIILLGCILRLADLGSKDIQYDEGFTVRVISGGIDQIFEELAKDHHPPLYYLLMYFWTFLGKSEFTLRLPSVVFSIAIIPLVYKLARNFFDERIALIAAYFVSISPYMILHGRVATYVASFAFFSLLSIFYLIKALKEDKLFGWVAYVISTVLCLYTNILALLLLAVQNLIFVCRGKKHKYFLKKWILSQAAIFLLFVPWMPVFIRQLNELQLSRVGLNILPTKLGLLVNFFYPFFTFALGETVLPWCLIIAIPAFLTYSVLFFMGLKALQQDKDLLYFVMSYLFVVLVCGVLTGQSASRYYLFVAPAFYVIIVLGWSRISARNIRVFLVAVITALSSSSMYNYYTNRQFHMIGTIEPWREVDRYIESNTHEGDVIIQSYINHSFDYYYKGNLKRYIVFGDIKQMKGNYFYETIPCEDISEIIRPYNRVWLIVSSAGLAGYKSDKSKAYRQYIQKELELIRVEYFMKDEDFEIKKRLIKKPFYDYRIKVYLYKVTDNAIAT